MGPECARVPRLARFTISTCTNTPPGREDSFPDRIPAIRVSVVGGLAFSQNILEV